MKEASYITLPGCHAARLFFAKKEFLRSRVEKKNYFSFHSVTHHNLTCWQPETRKYMHIKVGVSVYEKLDKHYSQLSGNQKNSSQAHYIYLYLYIYI